MNILSLPDLRIRKMKFMVTRINGLVTTPAPGLSAGTMRERVPRAAVEGSARMARPPRERAAPPENASPSYGPK